jgi:hypothetical protein
MKSYLLTEKLFSEDDRHQAEDEGGKHIWNVGQFLQDYTTQYPRRQ